MKKITTKQPLRQASYTLLPIIGWREWVKLPALCSMPIKAKVDTGARTSALHAVAMRPFKLRHRNRIRFEVAPLQHDEGHTMVCTVDLIGTRLVSDSGGHIEERYVICTPISLLGQTWLIEVTLTERKSMLFRMLLGRRALTKRFLVHPSRSFIVSKSKVSR